MLIWFVVLDAFAWGLYFRTRSLAAPAGWHWMNNAFLWLGVAATQ